MFDERYLVFEKIYYGIVFFRVGCYCRFFINVYSGGFVGFGSYLLFNVKKVFGRFSFFEVVGLVVVVAGGWGVVFRCWMFLFLSIFL